MPRVALFWQQLQDGRVRCELCPHQCTMTAGQDGLCRVRGNRKGKLESLVYGLPASIVSDEIEKKDLYHFHPGTRALSLATFGCNVLCLGCQNWQLSHAGAKGNADRLPALTPQDAVALARRHKLPGMVWTYNEPVVWLEYVHDVAVACREAGLYTAFATAGYLTQEALDYIAPHLGAYRFDLKAATPAGWAKLTKVKDPAPALEMAKRAKRVHGCHVEVSTNVVPTINDDDASIESMAAWIVEFLGPDTPWHLTRFLPDFELSYLGATPIKTLEHAAELARKSGLDFVYVGNVPEHPGVNTVCPACGRTVIKRGKRGAYQVRVEGGLCVFCGRVLNVMQ